MEQSTDVGLVKGHAYGITMVKAVTLEGKHENEMMLSKKKKTQPKRRKFRGERCLLGFI